MAALQELADTGTYSGAQQNIGASQDAALGRQAGMESLIGAPAGVSGYTAPQISQPYGRFSDAVGEYAQADSLYDQSMESANQSYFAQVADAQAAHRAEADRAISEAQRSYSKRNGSDEDSLWGKDLSQWEVEALATEQGGQYQQEATAEEGQNAQVNQQEAELAQMLDAWRFMGEQDQQGQRAVDYEMQKNQATDDERARAQQQWESENQDNPVMSEQYHSRGSGDTVQTEGRTPFQQAVVEPARNAERDQFVAQYAGSDRLGGSLAEREQAYRDEVANRNSPIVINGAELQTAETGGEMSMPDGTVVPRTEANEYIALRQKNAMEAAQRQRMLEMYKGGEFKQQAALDLNLRPDLSPAAQEILYGGMFPERTAEEQMDDITSEREFDYFNKTGFKNPGDERSWTEAERKNAGEPDPNSTKVRRPDDPDVLAFTGLDARAVAAMRERPEWEEALGGAETYIDPPEDQADLAVFSPSALKAKLVADGYDPEMVNLIVAMYGPSMVG